MLMLCGVFAFAQSRVVSGKVTDKDGNPVPFASVKVKGSKTGLSADATGTGLPSLSVTLPDTTRFWANANTPQSISIVNSDKNLLMCV